VNRGRNSCSNGLHFYVHVLIRGLHKVSHELWFIATSMRPTLSDSDLHISANLLVLRFNCFMLSFGLPAPCEARGYPLVYAMIICPLFSVRRHSYYVYRVQLINHACHRVYVSHVELNSPSRPGGACYTDHTFLSNLHYSTDKKKIFYVHVATTITWRNTHTKSIEERNIIIDYNYTA